MKQIKIQGYSGTWSEIDSAFYRGKEYYLMESDIHGEGVPAIIVDKYLHVIIDDCYSGINVALGDYFGVPYESIMFTDETEQEDDDDAMMDELEYLLLSQDCDEED